MAMVGCSSPPPAIHVSAHSSPHKVLLQLQLSHSSLADRPKSAWLESNDLALAAQHSPLQHAGMHGWQPQAYRNIASPCESSSSGASSGHSGWVLLQMMSSSSSAGLHSEIVCGRRRAMQHRAQWRAPGANMAVAVLWLPREP